MLQLLGREIPREFGQQIVNVLLNGFMFATRRIPDLVQIEPTQGLLFDDESKDLLQFLDVLRLMQAITKDNVQHLIVLYPLLER